MSRKEFEQRWARKSLREMLSAVEERVGKLEEFMEDTKEDSVQEFLDSQRKKLTERNNVLEAMMMALKEETMATTMALSTRIEELEGELALCQAVVGKGVLNTALSNEDVPKLKEFVGTRSTCDVGIVLLRIYRERSLSKVVRDNATGHSGRVCSRVQGTHAPNFKCDRERSITYFLEWIEAVGQTGGGTKRCPKAVESHDGS
ncbi:hypothetical protein Gotur_021248 [Gossypium turneri]